MEYIITFIIQQDDLSKVGMVEEFASWRGELISYTPRRFHIENNIRLRECESTVKTNSVIEILLEWESESELERQVNMNPELFRNNSVMKLLEKICCLDYYSISIQDVDEKIEKVFELDDKNCQDIYEIVAAALSYDNPRSFKICNHQYSKV